MKTKEAFPTVFSVKSWVSQNKSRILIGIGIFLFMWLVWPTPWRYFKDGRTNCRQNRITGKVQTFTLGSWD